MKMITMLLQIFLMQNFCFAQKPFLTDSSYKDWTILQNSSISPNGRFVIYDMYNFSSGETTTNIVGTDQEWKIKSATYTQTAFTNDNKSAYCVENGWLLKVSLGKPVQQKIAKCDMFTLFTRSAKEYIAFRIDSSKTLVVRRSDTGNESRIANAENFKLSPDGHLLIQQAATKSEQVLIWFDPANAKSTRIYSGVVPENIIFDITGEKIAFTTLEDNRNSLWYYSDGLTVAKQVLNHSRIPSNQSIAVNDAWEFSSDGKKLYFTLPEVTPAYKNEDTEPDIWSYKDQIVFSEFKKTGFRKYPGWQNLSSLNLADLKYRQLLFGNERIAAPGTKHGNNQFVMRVKDGSDTKVFSYYIVDENSNSKILIKKSQGPLYDLCFSPDQKFLTYRDEEVGGYRCFEIASGKTHDFTTLTVPDELYLYNTRTRGSATNHLGILGWIKGSTHVVMQGKYSLWELDVRNQDAPRKLTPSDDQHIFYSFCSKPADGTIDSEQDIYVFGVNNDNKDASLWRLNIRKKSFSKLYSGNFFWGMPYQNVDTERFQRAANAKSFLVSFPTATNYPNLLFTKDFKQFDTLTTIHPERRYNWITTELHTYKDGDGNICQGILYKPENFNSNKKYPVIFNFYQTLSGELNQYVTPQPISTDVNIPLLVSNGYLVFRPDIYVDKDKFGEYLMLSIDAATDHLKHFDWVDSSKLALAGHSYGGSEVDYIITHSQRFAAALSGAGASNQVNEILDLGGYKGEENRYFAGSHAYIKTEFELNPQMFIDNSPIFNTRKVSTPVLILHNDNDPIVPFYQSQQFFLSLRHLGKPAWLINYGKGGHGVIGSDKIDYQYRVKGFFDHYLKGEPMPAWMEKHISN